MIYTIGYAKRVPNDIALCAEEHGATVVDIRLSARSRFPEWNKGRFGRLLGTSYVHMPELGNLNYRGKGVVLNNPAAAVPAIDEYLKTRGSVILMCVCPRVGGCHRLEASQFLHQHFPEHGVHHLDDWLPAGNFELPF